jgi:hypothetical protein
MYLGNTLSSSRMFKFIVTSSYSSFSDCSATCYWSPCPSHLHDMGTNFQIIQEIS